MTVRNERVRYRSRKITSLHDAMVCTKKLYVSAPSPISSHPSQVTVDFDISNMGTKVHSYLTNDTPGDKSRVPSED